MKYLSLDPAVGSHGRDVCVYVSFLTTLLKWKNWIQRGNLHTRLSLLLSVFSPFIIPFQIFLNKCPNLRKKLLVPCVLDPPSANCYVCVSKPEVTVKLNVHKTMVLSLQDKVTE